MKLRKEMLHISTNAIIPPRPTILKTLLAILNCRVCEQDWKIPMANHIWWEWFLIEFFHSLMI